MYKELDPLLHSQLRLAIISTLIANKEADFNYLKDITKATAGNLSIQIKKLHEADYITVNKSFKNNYQNTTVRITAKGIAAFEDYVKSLKDYIER
jgi:DNA-binding MarR family transcriptional regulator